MEVIAKQGLLGNVERACLNCGNLVADRYCGFCGQKASTHRYSIKHFVLHDVVHGIWHLDRGVIRTVSDLLLRPGIGVREYLLGKRVGYFNVITLILMILAVSGLLAQYTTVRIADLMPEASRESMTKFDAFITGYPKVVLLLMVPINALFSFLWFRRAGFNYTEHLVLNAYKTVVELIIGLAFSVVSIFCSNITLLTAIYFLIVQLLAILYSVIYYHNFFDSSGYSKRGVILRALLAPLSVWLCAMLVGMILGMLSSRA